jgi:hypothetical protein
VVEESRIPREIILTVGGWASLVPGGPCTIVEAFNPFQNKWTMLNIQLPSNRAYHGIQVIKNKVINYL